MSLALLAGAGLSACGAGNGSSWGEGREEGIPAVEAVEVRYGSLPLEERLAGSVRARNQTEIYAEVAGTIAEVLVDDGARVQAGDPLVRLRAVDFEERVRQAESGLQVADARVKQAEANLTRLQANLERIRSITEQGLGPASELDVALADALSAEADLELVRAQSEQAASLLSERRSELAETVVRAPIDGVVGDRDAEVGQQANTSTPLFVIGDPTSVRVSVTLTQRMLGYIDTGTSVNIYSGSAPDEVIRAEVTRISPFLHPVTHTTRAEIDVAEHGGVLRPGMFVTVDVLYGESEQAPLVPNSAIYRHPRDGREGVFVASLAEARRDPETEVYPSEPEVEDYSLQDLGALLDPVGPATVSFLPVEVLARGRMSSAIRGVRAGDWVVTLGHHLLSADDEGQQAVIQPTPWDHILSLQQMQTRDLLDVIRDKQLQNQRDAPVPN